MKSKTISTVFDNSLLERTSRSFSEIDIIVRSNKEAMPILRFDLKRADIRVRSYYTVDSQKRPSHQVDEHVWGGWNQTMLMLIQRYSNFFACQMHSISSVKRIFDEIPEGYKILSRLKNLEVEVGVSECVASVNIKSLFSMLRFLPILEEKSNELSIDIDDETGRFCVSFAAQIGGGAKKTLDLVFTDEGEILFTYIEGGQGFSRISGSSYLTEYLVNSSKFRKLINIFDY